MNKKLFSLIGGFIIGIFISYLTLDYNGWQYSWAGPNGTDVLTINDLDYNLLTNASIITIGTIITIYLIWSFIEKLVSKN